MRPARPESPPISKLGLARSDYDGRVRGNTVTRVNKKNEPYGLHSQDFPALLRLRVLEIIRRRTGNLDGARRGVRHFRSRWRVLALELLGLLRLFVHFTPTLFKLVVGFCHVCADFSTLRANLREVIAGFRFTRFFRSCSAWTQAARRILVAEQRIAQPDALWFRDASDFVRRGERPSVSLVIFDACSTLASHRSPVVICAACCNDCSSFSSCSALRANPAR